MNEGAPITWIWMGFPLVGLAINLVWPRKRSLKAVGIVLLLLTAYLHGFFGLNPLDRVVGLAERTLTGEQKGVPDHVLRRDHVVWNLRFGQALAHQTMFDV